MKTTITLKARQGGAVAIIVGLSLFMLIGFLALVLDLGHLYIAKTELQNAADAAALAGAKELNGTATGITSAINKATEAAARNNYDFSRPVTITSADIQFSTSPDGPWDDGTNPVNKRFIKVDTGSRNLDTWFAPIWNIFQTSTFGMAVAGSYPPGALSPLFVPVVRRNSDQLTFPNPTAYPFCSGKIYDDQAYKTTCPTAGAPTAYRGPDSSGNWGFLKPGESRTFSSDGSTETGKYFVVTPRANNKWDTGGAYVWQVGTSWTGNFGFMLKGPGVTQQKYIMAALCRGGGMYSYPVPGCGEVHTGQLSGGKTAANLNTRFDMQSHQTELPHELCPSDTNIIQYSAPPPGNYSSYLANPQASVPLPNFPPGKSGRRVIRLYVADNVWLPGYNDAGTSNDDACYAQSLKGGSEQAHLVGCADFFMWKAADSDGALYAEYVGPVPLDQCKSTVSSFTEIRLYH